MAGKSVVNITKLPPPGIPASRAIRVGDLVFVAGTPPRRNPTTGAFDGDIRDQVTTCLETIQIILEEAGTSLDNAVSVITHLKTRDHFAAYNEEYVKFFPKDPPVRTTVQAELMPPDMLVEITVIAASGS
jgi:2-iminobutanoate/2-iminopropanoate deaminase